MPRGHDTRRPSRTGRHEPAGRVPPQKAAPAAGKTLPGKRTKSSQTKSSQQPASRSNPPARIASGPRPKTRKGYDPVSPERVAEILRRLDATYPKATCALQHRNAWELLVATILSAQCTDVRVNMVTPELFRKYPTVHDFARLSPEQLEPDIRSTGFFRNKSKSVIGAARKVANDHGGEVPSEMDQLLELPGVARKTANVLLGTWFHKNVGVVVDTHVLRISRRLELTRNASPEKIEQDLMRVIPQERWTDYSHEIIWHGRKLCVARSPKCVDCPLEDICHSPDKTWSTVEIHTK